MADCVAGQDCNDVTLKYDPKSVKVTGITITGGASLSNTTEDKLKKFANDNGLGNNWDDIIKILKDKCNPPSHQPPDYQATSKGSCPGEKEGTCACVASKIPNPKNPKELIPFVTVSDVNQSISVPGSSVGGKKVDLNGTVDCQMTVTHKQCVPKQVPVFMAVGGAQDKNPSESVAVTDSGSAGPVAIVGKRTAARAMPKKIATPAKG